MESFYYQGEEWVSLREAVNWIYYGKGNYAPPTLENSNNIFEELKRAVEKEHVKALRVGDKTRAFKIEDGLFFNVNEISVFFKIELYLFYKTAMDHFFFIEKTNLPEAPLPNSIQNSIQEKATLPQQSANRTSIGKHAANIRWEDSPTRYAMCKAYEEWKMANKSSGYRSKLAAHLLQNVDGIKGILTSQKYLAERFGKWDKGEDLPEC